MSQPQKWSRFYPIMFGLIGLIFIVILLVVYRISVKANPVMLNEQGQQHGHR